MPSSSRCSTRAGGGWQHRGSPLSAGSHPRCPSYEGFFSTRTRASFSTRGIPRRLDPSEIVAALRNIAELAVAKKGTPWPTTGTIRQLARPELADAMLGLLREYRGIREVERHLLRYAELGRYQTCRAHALASPRSTAPPTRHHAPAPCRSSPKSAAHRRGRRFSTCSRRRAWRSARSSFRRSCPITCAVTPSRKPSFGRMITSFSISLRA